MILEAHIMEELANIVKNGPVFPGNTISHRTAAQCEARGWARRDYFGDWRPTRLGQDALRRWLGEHTHPDEGRE